MPVDVWRMYDIMLRIVKYVYTEIQNLPWRLAAGMLVLCRIVTCLLYYCDT